MVSWNPRGKVNVKVLVILIVVVVALGVALVAARQVRRNILSKRDFEAGTVAYEKGDWVTAYKHFQEYLGRNPDDLEILKKYAEARLAVRPTEPGHLSQAMVAYRRILQLDPLQDTPYEKLAMLYAGLNNFEDLAYIANMRLEHEPNDLNAPLWLSEALVRLNRTNEARETLSKFIERLERDSDDHEEYVRACAQMSTLEVASNMAGSTGRALEWLNKAIARFPNSVEALAARARFYRAAPTVPDVDQDQRRLLARQDLTKADEIGTTDPRIRLFLAEEWMAHGEFDKVAAELEAADRLSTEDLEERYFDLNTWTVERFKVASELMMRTGRFAEGVTLAAEVLDQLEERGHRISVLPGAIRLYVAAGDEAHAAQAAVLLKEYEDALYVMQKAGQAKLELAYLQALVARAQGDSYGVIDALQPIIASGSSYPELLRLLAEAFSRTDQPRRAVDMMLRELRNRPNDLGLIVRLINEYIRLQDWTQALEMAKVAESILPTEASQDTAAAAVTVRLLRIEAAIYVAGEQEPPDLAQLEALQEELATLRADEKNAKRLDIRMFQARIGVYMAQAEQDEQARRQKFADVAEELRRAIQECDKPLRAEMQLVRLYADTEQTDQAIEACQAACERHPETAEPWLLLADLQVNSGDPNSAIQSLQKAQATIATPGEKRSLTMQQALLELIYGDRTTGIELLSELAARDPRDIRARTLLLDVREVRADSARTEQLVQELEKAEGQTGLMWRLYRASTWLSGPDWRLRQQEIVELLQYCIDADPQWVAPPMLLAELYGKLGDTGRVEETCRQALVRNPSAVLIADKLVTLLEEQDRFSDAQEVRQQAQPGSRVTSIWNYNSAVRAEDWSRAVDELLLRISNDEKNQDVESRVMLAGLLHEKMHDSERALVYLDEAEAIASPSLATSHLRAEILRTQGHDDQAQQILDDYVRGRGDFTAYLLRAGFHLSEGQLEQAEADYKKLTSFSDPGEKTAGYALLSDFYANQQRIDQAIATLEEGLHANPDDLALQSTLMRRLLRRNSGQDRDRALAILTSLEEKLPQDPGLMQIRAMELLREGDASIEAARNKLEEVIRLDSTAVLAYQTLINIAMQQGQYETARGYAIRGVGANPEHPPLLAARGRAEVALGNPEIATELARLALAQDPNSADALAVLVDVAVNTANDDLVKEVATAARRISPTDPNRAAAVSAISARAIASRHPTLLAEARQLLEAELSRTPSNSRLLVARAEILVNMGLAAEAIPELADFCGSEAGAESLDAILTLADLYRLTGSFDEAYRYIDRARELAPKSQSVVHARFLCLLAQERFDDLAQISSSYIACSDQNPTQVIRAAAILTAMESKDLKNEGVKLFEHAVETWPEFLDAQLGLASALYQVGQIERAKQAYRGVLDNHPENMQALNDLAWILQENDGDYATALDLANQGLSLQGSDADRKHLLDTRGTILSKMPNRLPDAKADFEELVKLTAPDSPQRAKALLNLGRVCAKLGESDQARQHLEEALKIDEATPVFTPEERTEAQDLLK